LQAPVLDDLPGFRRRFRITPGPDWSMAELEDDVHCMAVTLRHRDGTIVGVEAEEDRHPWTTCVGAMAQLEQTFTGVRLDEVPARGEKTANCTHLYDLATLAAAHAGDPEPLLYDILVSDPIGTRRHMELRRNGAAMLSWVEEDGRLVEPAEVAGQTLMGMSRWLAGLAPEAQEPARVLRWGAMVAHGRTMPMAEQSDATRMPPNCYTFQPEIARYARRVGLLRDFSRGEAQPLDGRPAPSPNAFKESRP
jgi:hypothetical protein